MSVEEFCPLLFAVLLQFFEVCRCSIPLSSLKVPPQRFTLEQVWTWTGPLQRPVPFSFSDILDLLLSLGPLFCCTIRFHPSVSCQTDGLTPDSKLWSMEEFLVNSETVRRSDHVQAQIITPPSPCFTTGTWCFCIRTVFPLWQTWCCALWEDTFGLICPKDMVPKVLLFRCNFTNPGQVAIFRLREKRLPPGKYPSHFKTAPYFLTFVFFYQI